jgi:hypothetical protein
MQVAVGVHPLVYHHGKPLFGLVETADDAEHLIHHRSKLTTVMEVARIDAIVQR